MVINSFSAGFSKYAKEEFVSNFANDIFLFCNNETASETRLPKWRLLRLYKCRQIVKDKIKKYDFILHHRKQCF